MRHLDRAAQTSCADWWMSGDCCWQHLQLAGALSHPLLPARLADWVKNSKQLVWFHCQQEGETCSEVAYLSEVLGADGCHELGCLFLWM